MRCLQCNESGDFLCQCMNYLCSFHVRDHSEHSNHHFRRFTREIDEYLKKCNYLIKKIIACGAQLLTQLELIIRDVIKVTQSLKKLPFQLSSDIEFYKFMNYFLDLQFPENQLKELPNALTKIMLNEYVNKLEKIIPKSFNSLDNAKQFYAENGLFLEGHKSRVSALAITNDDIFLVSGSYDMSLIIWNMKTRKQEASLVGHGSNITAVAISSDNKFIFSGARDNTVIKWNFSTRSIQLMKTLHKKRVCALLLTNDCNLVISGGSEPAIVASDFSDLSKKFEIILPSPVYSLAFTTNQRYLLSGCDDFIIRKININTRQQEAEFIGHTKLVTSIKSTNDNDIFFSKANDLKIIRWSLTEGKSKVTYEATENECNIVVSKDRACLITDHSEKSIRKYDLKRGTQSAFKNNQNKKIRSMILTNDNNLIICGDKDTVSVWNFHDPSIQYVFEGHTKAVTVIAVTNDKNYLLSGSDDTTLRIWDLLSRNQVAILLGHEDSILSIAVTDDDKRAFSGGKDKKIIIWDLESHTQIFELLDHNSPVKALVINSKNQLLTSGGDDYKVIRWNMITLEIVGIHQNQNASWAAWFPKSIN